MRYMIDIYSKLESEVWVTHSPISLHMSLEYCEGNKMNNFVVWKKERKKSRESCTKYWLPKEHFLQFQYYSAHSSLSFFILFVTLEQDFLEAEFRCFSLILVSVEFVVILETAGILNETYFIHWIHVMSHWFGTGINPVWILEQYVCD